MFRPCSVFLTLHLHVMFVLENAPLGLGGLIVVKVFFVRHTDI